MQRFQLYFRASSDSDLVEKGSVVFSEGLFITSECLIGVLDGTSWFVSVDGMRTGLRKILASQEIAVGLPLLPYIYQLELGPQP